MVFIYPVIGGEAVAGGGIGQQEVVYELLAVVLIEVVLYIAVGLGGEALAGDEVHVADGGEAECFAHHIEIGIDDAVAAPLHVYAVGEDFDVGIGGEFDVEGVLGVELCLFIEVDDEVVARVGEAVDEVVGLLRGEVGEYEECVVHLVGKFR